MEQSEIRKELETLIEETRDYDPNKIPTELLKLLQRWQWGKYGWISPASLMFTAAWRKYYYPNIDCCKIWARDDKKRHIPGGYSIRNEDEEVSIPVLAKYDLCKDFCSPNSGMQGSRAIEKMRSLHRLNKDIDLRQRTIFDFRLFALIMNAINDLDKEQLWELLKYFIMTTKHIKARRDQMNAQLEAATTRSFDMLDALAQIHDPELTKCVAAACIETIFSGYGAEVLGVDDAKTAADARAGKPGDICVQKDGKIIVAIEVKDKTQSIDWNNIERAKRIIKQHPDMISFIFVLESRDSATNKIVNEIVKAPQLATGDGKIVSIMSLKALYQLAKAIKPESELIHLTSRYIAIAPSIKIETRQSWASKIH